MLFGEYTVLVGSRALAIPATRWGGKWTQGEGMDSRLTALVEYLMKSDLAAQLSIDSLLEDIKNGLRFESTIPFGYGLGSSAALTAAIYDVYGPKEVGVALDDIITRLATIESFYHGHSSGLDPLVSYLDHPVLFENGTCHNVDLPSVDEMPQIFLINSGIERFTAPLVALFKSRLSDTDFVEDIILPLKANVDHVVEYFLNGSWELFWDCLQLISDVQYERFKEMLPEQIEHIWRGVSQNSGICLKLCGAGGGGFFLGFARPDIDVESEIGCAVELIRPVT